jgi:hypothetical protein
MGRSTVSLSTICDAGIKLILYSALYHRRYITQELSKDSLELPLLTKDSVVARTRFIRRIVICTLG